MLLVLQVSVALIFFVNKVLVLIGKRSGWIFGACGAALAIWYLYLINLYVYTAAEAGLFVLMLHGFRKNGSGKPNEMVEIGVRFLTLLVMLLLSWFAFNGFLTIVEFASACGLLIATYLIAEGYVRSGWALAGLAHLCAMYLTYPKGQTFFADFQAASAAVSFIGAYYGTLETKG